MGSSSGFMGWVVFWDRVLEWGAGMEYSDKGLPGMGSWDILCFVGINNFSGSLSFQAERLFRHFGQMWLISPRIL